MPVITGWGGCFTEFKQLEVALTQLTEQSMHLEARKTLLRMLALVAALDLVKPPSSQMALFREEFCLDLHQQLIICMVGPLHTV